MSAELRVMDLFSGIGGFSLGLKRAGGFKTVAYCEIDPYCQKVLQARMRDGSLDTAPICTDITKLDGKPWRGHVDLICGGFPCQDISMAGKGVGIDGERSGLWSEYARLIREIRPRFAFVENVAALSVRGLQRVLGDLADMGFDAEWRIVPACRFGAAHCRERLWIISDSKDNGFEHPVDAKGSGNSRRRIFNDIPATGNPIVIKDRFEREVRAAEFVRTANGIPYRVDRIHALGNAVVPQVVEWIGRRIRECVTEL